MNDFDWTMPERKRIVCDRCGEACEGTTYYNIDILAHDINPIENGLVSSETFSHNILAYIEQTINTRKRYCKRCMDEIKEFMEEKR